MTQGGLEVIPKSIETDSFGVGECKIYIPKNASGVCEFNPSPARNPLPLGKGSSHLQREEYYEMLNACIGSNGFIGSRIKWYADNFMEEECVGINRENYDKWKGQRFNKLIWAAGSARKDLTVPQLLEANCLGVHEALHDFYFRKVIYVSSQAVYADPKLTPEYNEMHHIIPAFLDPYGLSKYLGEAVVRESCADWLILRPNGFVGPGLKKNVIHSLAKNPPELYYTVDSKFQLIHTDTFAELVFMLSSACSNEIFNVAIPEVVTPVDVAEHMGVDIEEAQIPHDRTPPQVNAVFSTKQLETFLRRTGFQLPSIEEAISSWNDPIKIRVHSLREAVGESGSK